MSDGSAPVAPVGAPGFWSQFRRTFGPALVGLVGGGLTVGVSLAATATLLQNVATTYAGFPSLQPPWLARDFSLPTAALVPLVILGVVAPFGMGLATAWLVRGKDRWSEVSAGFTTALTSSVAAYAVGLGWAVTLAMVVVPSISDLTLFERAVRAPADAAAKPSDVLAERYPDLQDKPADERGGRFFGKIVADQVVGSAYGVWLGIGLSFATVGALGFCGTLAGGWLLRRGGSWRSVVVPYFELTVATSLAAGRMIAGLAGFGTPITWPGAVCLVTAAALVVLGVVGRWPPLLRVALAVTWGLVFWGVGLDDSSRMPAPIGYFVYSLLGFLLARHWYLSAGRPVPAAA